MASNFRSRFAHLVGMNATAPAAKKAEGNDDDPRARADGETDDEYEARMKALDDEEKEKAGKNAKASDDDEEVGDEAKAARLRERARCAAIFASPAAAGNIGLAAKLAFDTNMPRALAIYLLEDAAPPAPAPAPATTTPASRRSGAASLASRMEGEGGRPVAADTAASAAPAGSAAALVEKMTAVYNQGVGRQ